jgi:hypothetical protein
VLDALGDWPLVGASSALTILGLLYRCYRLRVQERMHARELASAERRHARELQVAWGAAQVGAVATFSSEGTAVMPPIHPAKVTLGHPLQPLPAGLGSESPSSDGQEPPAPVTPPDDATVAKEPSQSQPRDGPAHG